MKRYGLCSSAAAILMFATCLMCTASARGATFSPRTFDFESPAGSAWSTGITYQVQGNKVLGLFNDRNKHYEEGTHLRITGVPNGAAVTLSFDLYLVGSWDSEGTELADRWTLTSEDGATLLELKNFPNAYKDKEEKEPIGAKGQERVGNRDLDYWVVNETVTIPPDRIRNGAVTLHFRGYLTGRKTEFWGLDNVTVKTGS